MHIELNDVLKAKKQIEGIVRRTPFDLSPKLSEATGGEIYLKMEALQKTGSFKLRGAANKMSQLSAEERKRGVITASAGNHAQGVAFVAKLLGIDTTIVIPGNAPETKIANTRRYGVNVVIDGTDYDDSERIAHEIEKESGRVYVHAFNDPYIMAGQGTVAYEMLEEQPDLDILIVPVGGGGLMTGAATAAKGLSPNIQVIGVQPENSKPWYEASKQKKYVKVEILDSWADGLTGEIVPEMVDEFNAVVDDMVVVDEESIKEAIFWMADNHHQITEGSAVAGIAALLSGKLDVAGKKVGIVVTGSNLDTKKLKIVLNEYMKEK